MSPRLVAAELRRAWIDLRRYPLEAVGELLFVTILFYGLFLGASYLSDGAVFGSRLADIVVGYTAFTLMAATMATFTWEVQREALAGTLEQVFMGAFGPLKVLVTRAVARVGINLVITLLILVILTLITRADISLDPLVLVPVLIALLGACGVGLMLGGLALVFKRVESVAQLVQYGMLFLLVTPVESLGMPLRALLYVAPFSSSVALMRDVLARGAGLNAEGLLLALANSLFYAALGVACFLLALRSARHRGIVSSY